MCRCADAPHRVRDRALGTVADSKRDAVSVFKAAYLDKRYLKCACVGGASNLPLGFVSLTENLMMVAMAAWMLAATKGL